MINENHFRFDRKNLFNFWKTIYGLKTVNHFPKLNSSSLHACLISNCPNLAMVGSQNPSRARIRQHPATGILPAPEFGHRRRMHVGQIPAGIQPWSEPDQIWPKWPLIRLDLAKMVRIWTDPTTDSEESGRNPPKLTWQIDKKNKNKKIKQ